MANYVLMAIGIFTILITSVLLFLDRIKGEDVYLSIDIKEQEIKKVIEDADEIISELNYTSEMVVKEIEEKLSSFRNELRSCESIGTSPPAAEKKDNAIVSPIAVNPAKKKKITGDDKSNDVDPEGKLSQKQQMVFDYASQGMSVTDIAKQMNIGQGEVMLILSLNNEVE